MANQRGTSPEKCGYLDISMATKKDNYTISSICMDPKTPSDLSGNSLVQNKI